MKEGKQPLNGNTKKNTLLTIIIFLFRNSLKLIKKKKNLNYMKEVEAYSKRKERDRKKVVRKEKIIYLQQFINIRRSYCRI